MTGTDPRCTVVYTAGYAPPEQMIGRPEPRSDLFALAATLYHLATGRVPRGWQTAEDIDAELGKPENQQYLWFFELLRINLAEDIGARYFSAQDFKADLERRQVCKEQTCSQCQTLNEARRPYCIRCAKPLTDSLVSCRQCGKQNRMGSRFCIDCGHPVR